MDNLSTVVKCKLGNLRVYVSDNTSSIEKEVLYIEYIYKQENIYL